VVHDETWGTVSAVLRIDGHGFPLASTGEQESMLDAWGAALSPCARERSPVRSVTWQAWAHPSGPEAHEEFLAGLGIKAGSDVDAATADYLALVDQQAPVTVAHDVLVTVTVDERRVRARRSSTRRTDTAIEALLDEIRTLTDRMEAGGITVTGPLAAIELTGAARVRSDPGRAAQMATLTKSLAAAAQRGPLAWGPMVVEPEWTQCRVDGTFHRTYRVATWPQLPVGTDWMASLLTGTTAIRTVTVVMEPVPLGHAARAADREVMAREADADMREERGFRTTARDRKRLDEVKARERELAEGHAEFRFVGLVDVCGTDLDALDDACADVEQAAAQSLIDLRPLDARHDLGWAASLPVGRGLRPRRL